MPPYFGLLEYTYFDLFVTRVSGWIVTNTPPLSIFGIYDTLGDTSDHFSAVTATYGPQLVFKKFV